MCMFGYRLLLGKMDPAALNSELVISPSQNCLIGEGVVVTAGLVSHFGVGSSNRGPGSTDEVDRL